MIILSILLFVIALSLAVASIKSLIKLIKHFDGKNMIKFMLSGFFCLVFLIAGGATWHENDKSSIAVDESGASEVIDSTALGFNTLQNFSKPRSTYLQVLKSVNPSYKPELGKKFGNLDHLIGVDDATGVIEFIGNESQLKQITWQLIPSADKAKNVAGAKRMHNFLEEVCGKDASAWLVRQLQYISQNLDTSYSDLEIKNDTDILISYDYGFRIVTLTLRKRV